MRAKTTLVTDPYRPRARLVNCQTMPDRITYLLSEIDALLSSSSRHERRAFWLETDQLKVKYRQLPELPPFLTNPSQSQPPSLVSDTDPGSRVPDFLAKRRMEALLSSCSNEERQAFWVGSDRIREKYSTSPELPEFLSKRRHVRPQNQMITEHHRAQECPLSRIPNYSGV